MVSGIMRREQPREKKFFTVNFRTRENQRKPGIELIELETTDRNAPTHFTPAMTLDQLIDDIFQRDAVQ